MDAIFVATPHFLPSASPPFLPARCCLTASHITEASCSQHIPGCVQPLDDGPDGLPPNRLYILVQHTNSLLLLRSQVQTVTVRDQRHLLRRPHHPSAWREGSHPDSGRHRDAVVHDTYGPAQRWSVRGHVLRGDFNVSFNGGYWLQDWCSFHSSFELPTGEVIKVPPSHPLAPRNHLLSV